MNILYNRFDSKTSVAILALDAEKAFDQIEWDYILAVIREFNLGDTFASWVRMLYAQPRASVLTNFNR